MKRTIKEIYELIKEKRESARNDRERIRNALSMSKEWRDNGCIKLYGEIEAYTDVLVLLETSGVVEDEIVR